MSEIRTPAPGEMLAHLDWLAAQPLEAIEAHITQALTDPLLSAADAQAMRSWQARQPRTMEALMLAYRKTLSLVRSANARARAAARY